MRYKIESSERINVENDFVSTETFLNADFIVPIFVEIVLSLLHPNILLEGYTFTLNKSTFGFEMLYEWNDIMLIFLFLKLFSIWTVLVNMTVFQGVRAYRVSLFFNKCDERYKVDFSIFYQVDFEATTFEGAYRITSHLYLCFVVHV